MVITRHKLARPPAGHKGGGAAGGTTEGDGPGVIIDPERSGRQTRGTGSTHIGRRELSNAGQPTNIETNGGTEGHVRLTWCSNGYNARTLLEVLVKWSAIAGRHWEKVLLKNVRQCMKDD